MGFMINMSNSRKCALTQNKILEKIITGKEQRRKELAELSFKEKIHILVELQKMARGVKRHGKASDRIVWQI
jgi:ferritin-like protein